MKDFKNIGINIWDDFYDDGYVPEGEKLETYIYVDENKDDITEDEQKEILEIFLDHINKTLDIKDIKIWIEYYDSRIKYPNLNEVDYPGLHFTRWEIKVENLTHKRLDGWMEKIESCDLSYMGVPLIVYSES